MFTELPIWMRGSFVVLRQGRVTAIARQDFVETLQRNHLLEEEGWQNAGKAPSSLSARETNSAGRIPTFSGRGAAFLLEAGALGSAVVRPYCRGGLVRHFNRRRYWLGNRAFDELVTTQRLRYRGLPVPEPLAAIQLRQAGGYTALLATRWLPKDLPLSRELPAADATAAAAHLRSAARSIWELHRAGVWHADLNAHNILVAAGTDLAVIIDFDRARLLPEPLPAFLARQNLRRLRRSLRKLRLHTGLKIWGEFEDAYRTGSFPVANV